MLLNFTIKQQIKRLSCVITMQYCWKNHMWNIILNICLILPKSLTYLFIAVIFLCYYNDCPSTHSNANVKHFLETEIGDSLRIELNGLKINQLFGISRLILRSILIIDFINVS